MNTIVDWDRDTPQWSAVLAATKDCGRTEASSANTLWPLYASLVEIPAGQNVVIGQLGQSLDGRIATPTGHSHYINGVAALVHLHRLRALVDAVVVGVGTVVADDPQLTVRRAQGRVGASQPTRVVIDPRGRMPREARCLRDDGARRIVIQAGAKAAASPGVEYIGVPLTDGAMAPRLILAALAERGLRRILVEGGANTLSRFLSAGCLNRLHIAVAPMIIGSGPVGIELAAIDRLDDALRPRVTSFALPDGEVLFDCAFPSRIPS